LCEIVTAAPDSFVLIYALMFLFTLVYYGLLSGIIFRIYYVHPTYEQWRRKINPVYPAPEKVRAEIVDSVKGIVFSTFPPALALYLFKHDMTRSYCGIGDGSLYLVGTFFAVWFLSDCYQSVHHYLGHTISSLWSTHRHHHKFYNPTPFAVETDDAVDQLVHTIPVLLIPLMLPVNLDVVFFVYGALFLPWGVYHHLGHDLDFLDPHHRLWNTSYKHYIHHALSHMNKPFHCGMFLSLWDELLGSVYTCETCRCSRCARSRGERSFLAWEQVVKPDYSILLSPVFLLSGRSLEKGEFAALAGLGASMQVSMS